MDQWIGVDLDGTLMTWVGNGDVMGHPVPRMVDRVKFWLSQGKNVKIFTARASQSDKVRLDANIRAINLWCLEHLGVVLPVTCVKDYDCVEIWDDKAVRVVRNTGLTEWEYRKRKLKGFETRVRTRRV
jgi:hypothetical protein